MITITSCATTKYVGDEEYLLNKVSIDVEEDKISTSELTDYISQSPNKNLLFIPKFGLHIYSLSGRDTSKWINKKLRKWGSAPVIYDDNQTYFTQKQLVKRMQNLGYLNVQVSHCCDSANKKINVKYCVRPNDLYTINQFKTDIESTEMQSLLKSKQVKKLLKLEENAPFSSERFDEMSTNLTSEYWNMGYYTLRKENFYFLADTAIGQHKVDVTLKYRRLTNEKDSLFHDPALIRYKFRNVNILNGIDQNFTLLKHRRKKKAKQVVHDTINYEGFTIISEEEQFIRPSVLYNNIFIRPGRYYNTKLVDNTYNSLNALGAVSQVGVRISPVEEDSSLLDAEITLTPSNIYHFQYGIDGTNTAGDLGIASYLSFQQKNLFKGSEILAIKLNGAYEHIQGNAFTLNHSDGTSSEYNVETGNYYEYGGDVSLTIPRIILDFLPLKYRKQVGASTVFSFGLNWRKRPEFDRQFLSLDWKYNWYTHHKRLFHTFDLYNINYVVSKNISEWFTDYINHAGNELMKESYKDQFITRTSYGIVYSESSSKRNGWNFRGNISVAGTLPYIICSIFTEKEEGEPYTIGHTPFAQYCKGTFDVSKTFYVEDKTQIVAHIGFGVAVPYANSTVIPYEQRFFAGGANTVRGWNTRTLGPGSYDSRTEGNFITQTGDVKLMLNLEYRQQTNSFIDVAAFLDAGNIWTIQEYQNQEGGKFTFNSFYKELGYSWGIGLRPNFKFIVLRLDAGMQIYNPAYPHGERWVITTPSWKNTCALHFAVGYPF